MQKLVVVRLVNISPLTTSVFARTRLGAATQTNPVHVFIYEPLELFPPIRV